MHTHTHTHTHARKLMCVRPPPPKRITRAPELTHPPWHTPKPQPLGEPPNCLAHVKKRPTRTEPRLNLCPSPVMLASLLSTAALCAPHPARSVVEPPPPTYRCQGPRTCAVFRPRFSTSGDARNCWPLWIVAQRPARPAPQAPASCAPPPHLFSPASATALSSSPCHPAHCRSPGRCAWLGAGLQHSGIPVGVPGGFRTPCHNVRGRGM
ncbi:MAG: hypothetical protein J3K34DRAFT_58893 [Monoraphidium minutum]|nr:MAG: hypothetical protein J3K34DRAFT_58893 [Monoraphidium minutum]